MDGFTAGVNGTVESVMDMPLNATAQEINGRYDVSLRH